MPDKARVRERGKSNGMRIHNNTSSTVAGKSESAVKETVQDIQLQGTYRCVEHACNHGSKIRDNKVRRRVDIRRGRGGILPSTLIQNDPSSNCHT